jgi:hypothetical protein
MLPDRTDYEIWLIDWLDGKLDKTETGKLMEFLEKNPDIKEEAESLLLANLSPSGINMPHKDKMRRSEKELPKSQIEFLSVAYLENDLDPEQLEELNRNLEELPDNRLIFNTIQKIRLIPPQPSYRNKKSLKKITPAARIMRISLTALSAAAAITLLILSIIIVTDNVNEQHFTTAENYVNDLSSGELEIPAPLALLDPLPESQIVKAPEANLMIKTLTKENSRINDSDILEKDFNIQPSVMRDSIVMITGISIENIRVSVSKEIINNPLTISSNVVIPSGVEEDDRSRLNRFLARTFREKILKEDIISEKPVKPFELALAGINGINKLMGWEMALIETADNDGERRSVYFSSRLLKLNVPVKKAEGGQ